MLVNGIWVGWGLGDHSTADMTVKNAKAYMRAMYKSYAGGLADTNVFDQQMQDIVVQMQNRLVASGALKASGFILGVLDLPTEYAMGFKKRAPVDVVKPVIVTVEGHMSNMFYGPCADTATQLEGEGVCYHQPTGYDNGKIPFDNNDGVLQLASNVRNTTLPSGHKFPAGTPWGLFGYSQGGIIISQFWQQYLQPGQELAWRTPDLKCVLAYANPCRENNQQAPWSYSGGFSPNTQGLAADGERMSNTPDFWKEIGRHGDIFSENTPDEKGRIKSSIYELIMANLFRGPASILSVITVTLKKPLSEILPIALAIFDGIKFLTDNPNPHYAPFFTDPGKNYARQALRG